VKILFIRLRLIGDVVFTTPLVKAVRRTYPDAHLAYVVEPASAGPIEHSPHIDEMIVAPKRRGWARIADDLALARRLRRGRYDVVFDLHGGPRSAWLTWATGAPERIGYDIRGRRWMYTRRAPRARTLEPRHSVENQWDVLRAWSGWTGEPDRTRDGVEMAIDPAAERRIAERLRRAGVRDIDEIIVLHVSAGNPFRRWPEPFFVETAAALASDSPRRKIVFSSGPSDRGAADRIGAAARARLGPNASRIFQPGELDLQELRALIERSRLFIGGDTGPLHIAATTRTPVVGIYGPTLSARSAPWRDPSVPSIAVEIAELPCRPCDQRVCAPGDFRCLTHLPASQVIAAARLAIGERWLAPLAQVSRADDNNRVKGASHR
jgi:ADP-heptose:LPS heptosyltransferase